MKKIIGTMHVRKKIVRLLPLLLLVPIYIALYKIYTPKVNAFGCFDDCFNIVAGYFITNGKRLYSEIFFNHQPLMAYFSSFIQNVFHPINIYDLVLTHRQSIMAFGLVMNIAIILRFGLPMFGFVFLYEFSKFYVFGDRFLAEGVIVYPLVYMTGIVWQKYTNKRLYWHDFLLSSLFAWFVIFMREPYIIVTFVLYFLIFIGKPFSSSKKIASGLLVLLIVAFLSTMPLSEYFFNVVTVSSQTFFSEVGGSNLLGLGVINIFIYPILILFGGEWNIFRYFLVGLDLVTLTSFIFLFRAKEKRRALLILLLILGLANVRMVPPGKIFYSAFHMIVWYGLFISSLIFLLNDLFLYKKKIAVLLSISLVMLFAYVVDSSKSFIREKIDPHYEFITNYGKELQVGEVVRLLSKPTDTLYLDWGDDLIYWQAKRLSPYKYSWYTSGMPGFSRYRQARLEMFAISPPDFYFRFCTKEIMADYFLPKAYENDYQNIYSLGEPTCLYVKKSKIADIQEEKWQKAKEFLYELPKM
ncbi:MAG: hypothetical protein Q7K54_00680 [Candidatus Parcubacteria bacterium]|nr:hypothetical protein [Candidatus Parcubacteria bacterium]